MRDGLGSFQGLFINEAATHYSLRFSTDLALDGPSEVTSTDFSVGVGSAASLALINDAADGPVSGGKAFIPQPRVEVRDAGGNILVDDSASAIIVSFHSNPAGGALSPSSGTTAVLRRGVTQFRGLSIDRAGANYRLTYGFMQYEEARLKETSVSVDGGCINLLVLASQTRRIFALIFFVHYARLRIVLRRRYRPSEPAVDVAAAGRVLVGQPAFSDAAADCAGGRGR